MLGSAGRPEYSPPFTFKLEEHMNDKAAEYWDDWQQEALAAGVSKPLAALGIELMRTHRKNRWPKDFLGRASDGEVMIAMCLEDEAETELFIIENLYPYDTALIEKTKRRLCLH